MLVSWAAMLAYFLYMVVSVTLVGVVDWPARVTAPWSLFSIRRPMYVYKYLDVASLCDPDYGVYYKTGSTTHKLNLIWIDWVKRPVNIIGLPIIGTTEFHSFVYNLEYYLLHFLALQTKSRKIFVIEYRQPVAMNQEEFWPKHSSSGSSNVLLYIFDQFQMVRIVITPNWSDHGHHYCLSNIDWRKYQLVIVIHGTWMEIITVSDFNYHENEDSIIYK